MYLIETQLLLSDIDHVFICSRFNCHEQTPCAAFAAWTKQTETRASSRNNN